MRSYDGCITCKRRKLKCDEAKPTCGPCTKSSRDCCYVERSVFRTVAVRSSRSNRTRNRRRSSIRSPASVQDETVREADHVWVDVPARLTFVRVEDPHAPDTPDVSDAPNTPPVLRHVPEEVITDDEGAIVPESDHEDARTPLVPSESRHTAPISWSAGRTPLPDLQTPNSSLIRSSSCSVRGDVLVIQLIRHYREGPGQWLDLFDTGRYFSSKAPVMAFSSPLLKSAICALSSKHLCHLQRSMRRYGSGSHSAHGKYSILQYLGHEQMDWGYQSAEYYDQAISHLKVAVDSHDFERDTVGKEEIFASIALLCTYELMDAPGTAWKVHLSALPLFSSGSNAESSLVIIPRTPITGPIFWSLVRQDLLCAFISETQPRLDPKDLRLWQNAGLAADEHGFLQPFSPPGSAAVRMRADVEEDTKSNELTWLWGKIANFIMSGDAIIPEDYALPRGQRPSFGFTQEELFDRWNMLMTELHKWHSSLPATFKPTARTRVSSHVGSSSGRDREPALESFEQIWYELPLCAATMQSYHQANILLLVNRPQESTAIRSTVSARLKSYRQIQAEALRHAREVCGISLANPTDPLRINSVHALSVAGQVFYEEGDQRVVLDLLEEVERDLGWTTSYHAAKLMDEWAGAGRRDF